MSALNKKGLGRGFESLIPTDLLDESFDPTASQDDQISDLRHIKITQITADPDQPRRMFELEALEELAQSIKMHGILQPLVVTPHQGGYQIVAGERRFRAAQMAGLDKVPALVRTLSGIKKLELSLIENLQRKDLNVIETATAYLKLRDQFNLSLDEIANRVGKKSISTVSNTLRLLKLPLIVRQALADGMLTEGQARPLIGLDDEKINDVLPVILQESWSVRKIEQYVLDLKQQKLEKPATETDSSTVRYKNEIASLKKRFDAPIMIRINSKGAGKIVIGFKSDEDFKRIEKLLGDN